MRKYKVVITPRAITEIQHAVDYYNSRQSGLGKIFYNDFKREVSSVAQNPFSRAVRYDDVRFAVLDKFPYAAHYNIEENTIVVYGVISMYMDPETSWIKR